MYKTLEINCRDDDRKLYIDIKVGDDSVGSWSLFIAIDTPHYKGSWSESGLICAIGSEREDEWWWNKAKNGIREALYSVFPGDDAFNVHLQTKAGRFLSFLVVSDFEESEWETK